MALQEKCRNNKNNNDNNNKNNNDDSNNNLKSKLIDMNIRCGKLSDQNNQIKTYDAVNSQIKIKVEKINELQIILSLQNIVTKISALRELFKHLNHVIQFGDQEKYDIYSEAIKT